jgi:hypothetical protein
VAAESRKAAPVMKKKTETEITRDGAQARASSAGASSTRRPPSAQLDLFAGRDVRRPARQLDLFGRMVEPVSGDVGVHGESA